MPEAESMSDVKLMPELSKMQLFAIKCVSLFEATMIYEVSVFKFWIINLWNLKSEMSFNNELRALSLYLKSLSEKQWVQFKVVFQSELY